MIKEEGSKEEDRQEEAAVKKKKKKVKNGYADLKCVIKMMKVRKIFKWADRELQNKQDLPTVCRSFSYNPHYGFFAKWIARLLK